MLAYADDLGGNAMPIRGMSRTGPPAAAHAAQAAEAEREEELPEHVLRLRSEILALPPTLGGISTVLAATAFQHPLTLQQLTKLVSAFKRRGEWQRALCVFSSAACLGLRPDLVLVNAALGAAEKGRDMRALLHVLSVLLQLDSVVPDHTTARTAMLLLARTQSWPACLSLFLLMRLSGAALEPLVCLIVIAVLGRHHHWVLAEEVFLGSFGHLEQLQGLRESLATSTGSGPPEEAAFFHRALTTLHSHMRRGQQALGTTHLDGVPSAALLMGIIKAEVEQYLSLHSDGAEQSAAVDPFTHVEQFPSSLTSCSLPAGGHLAAKCAACGLQLADKAPLPAKHPPGMPPGRPYEHAHSDRPEAAPNRACTPQWQQAAASVLCGGSGAHGHVCVACAQRIDAHAAGSDAEGSLSRPVSVQHRTGSCSTHAELSGSGNTADIHSVGWTGLQAGWVPGETGAMSCGNGTVPPPPGLSARNGGGAGGCSAGCANPAVPELLGNVIMLPCCNSLLKTYADGGQHARALALLLAMSRAGGPIAPDIVSFNHMMLALSQRDARAEPAQTLNMFEQLLRVVELLQLVPTHMTLLPALQFATVAHAWDTCEELWALLQAHHIAVDAQLLDLRFAMLLFQGKWEEIVALYEARRDEEEAWAASKVTLYAVLSSFLRRSDPVGAAHAFSHLLHIPGRQANWDFDTLLVRYFECHDWASARRQWGSAGPVRDQADAGVAKLLGELVCGGSDCRRPPGAAHVPAVSTVVHTILLQAVSCFE